METAFCSFWSSEQEPLHLNHISCFFPSSAAIFFILSSTIFPQCYTLSKHRELNPVLCDNLEGWDGVWNGKGVQEGEDIYTPMADSC